MVSLRTELDIAVATNCILTYSIYIYSKWYFFWTRQGRVTFFEQDKGSSYQQKWSRPEEIQIFSMELPGFTSQNLRTDIQEQENSIEFHQFHHLKRDTSGKLTQLWKITSFTIWKLNKIYQWTIFISYIKFPGGPGSCFCTARNISRWTPRGFWWPRSPYWPSICIQFFCIEDPIPGAHRILIHAVPKSARPRPLNKRCCLKPPPKPNVLKRVQTSSCGFNSTRLEKRCQVHKQKRTTPHSTIQYIE
jgi:hypothetical protein